MRTRYLLPLFAAILTACSAGTPGGQEAPVASNIERVVVEEMVNGAAGAVADISIEGMSCEMMCGGSIKKALAQLPGVNSTEIRFIEGEENDHAVVDYDATKVSDEEMIEAIQSLHDGQYKVVSVHITKRVPGAGAVSTSARKVEETKQVSVINTSAIVVPGILGLLSYVLRL